MFPGFTSQLLFSPLVLKILCFFCGTFFNRNKIEWKTNQTGFDTLECLDSAGNTKKKGLRDQHRKIKIHFQV
uniref:Secreted protein n=1 Tax=Panagrolaimus sp. JU765 TaxID=591449 RepID=A0AC34QH87_9BILA